MNASPGPPSRPGRRPLGPPLVLGVLAFLLTVAYQETRSTIPERESRRERLADAVAARQAHTDNLEATLADLRERADRLARRSAQRRLQEVRALSTALGPSAGLVAMEGEGMVVTLADAADAPRSADHRIQDVDVQAVVNALWAAGAEAIAVNEQRVVATTAIRNAGEAVLVNYRVLTSPYRVVAIGPPAEMRSWFDASPTAERFRGWSQIYGLGFTVEEADELVVPGFGGALRLRHARAG